MPSPLTKIDEVFKNIKFKFPKKTITFHFIVHEIRKAKKSEMSPSDTEMLCVIGLWMIKTRDALICVHSDSVHSE